jgi:hypothetical protein
MSSSGKAAAAAASIHVAERGTRTPRGSRRCEIGRNVAFSTGSLESYFFAGWEAAAYDALLVAAAVEFADRTLRRTAHTWPRDIELRIPVHEVGRWRDRRVTAALHDALSFLTGDRWAIEFYVRSRHATPAQQGLLSPQPGIDAVIPFSNGLDSRAVAGLMTRDIGSRLVRIRLGAKASDSEALARDRQRVRRGPTGETEKSRLRRASTPSPAPCISLIWLDCPQRRRTRARLISPHFSSAARSVSRRRRRARAWTVF